MRQEIVHSQARDAEGNVIPVEITEGSAELMGVQGEVDSMLVAMEAGIYNVKKATCGTYSCETCNGVTDASVNPGSFTVAVGGTKQLNFIEIWNSGQQYNGGDWSSYNPSVATVNSSGLVTGIAAGSVNIHAQDHYYEPTYTAQFCGYNLPSCPVQPAFQPGALSYGTVIPTISGPNTVWYFSNLTVSGYATSIQLTASGGSSSTSWNITAGANKITVSSFTGSSITVLSSGTAFSSSVGDVKVTATVNGQTSAPFSLTTRTPNKLVPASIQTNCDSIYGYITTKSYSIQDQLQGGLPSAAPLNESFTSGWGVDYVGTNWNASLPSAGSDTTKAPNYSLMADHMSGQNKVNSPTPIPMPTCDLNSTPVVHIDQEWRIGSLASGFGRRVQTDTVQRYVGRADHFAIHTPNP
jgi:Bacterial Ig-like domain (group 2)